MASGGRHWRRLPNGVIVNKGAAWTRDMRARYGTPGGRAGQAGGRIPMNDIIRRTTVPATVLSGPMDRHVSLLITRKGH